MRPIRRILVAVKDPTAKSLPAVMKGAQLARAFGAHLELFHGISTPLYVDADPYAASVPQIERRMRDDFIKKLETIASNLRGRGLQVGVSVTWDFPVVRAVDTFHPNLLVIGARGEHAPALAPAALGDDCG